MKQVAHLGLEAKDPISCTQPISAGSKLGIYLIEPLLFPERDNKEVVPKNGSCPMLALYLGDHARFQESCHHVRRQRDLPVDPTLECTQRCNVTAGSPSVISSNGSTNGRSVPPKAKPSS